MSFISVALKPDSCHFATEQLIKYIKLIFKICHLYDETEFNYYLQKYLWTYFCRLCLAFDQRQGLKLFFFI